MNEEWLTIGKIVATQGLKGEVRIQSFSDFPERFMQSGTRWLAESETHNPQPTKLLTGRGIPGKNGIFVVRFDGIDTCDRAESLRNWLVMIPASQRPRLAKDEFHVLDLIDCEVFYQPTLQYLGRVINILEAGNDLLEIETEWPDKNLHKRIILIPFVAAIAPLVNIAQKRIEVLPPDGLIDFPPGFMLEPNSIPSELN
jgi:16S rRNA processing protein RimM